METNFKWFSKRIRDLHSEDNVVYGVGDEGIFIRSMNGGRTGQFSVFQQKQRVGMYVAMYKELLLLMEKKRCIFLIISV